MYRYISRSKALNHLTSDWPLGLFHELKFLVWCVPKYPLVKKKPTSKLFSFMFITLVVWHVYSFKQTVALRQGKSTQYWSVKTDSVMTRFKNVVNYSLEQFLHHWEVYYSDINHCEVRMSTKFKGCSLKSLNLLRGKLSDGAIEWIRLSSATAML